MGRRICGLLLGPVFGAQVSWFWVIRLLSPNDEGEHFQGEVLVVEEGRLVVCIGIKPSLALGWRLASLYGVPLGQCVGRITHTKRCARPWHGWPPTRIRHRKLVAVWAVEGRVRPVAGNAQRHGPGGYRTSGPGAPGSVHPSAGQHAVAESSPVPCGQSPRARRPPVRPLPSPPATS